MCLDELSSRADAAAAEAERGYIVCGQLLLVTAVVTLAAAIAVDPAACAPLAVGTAWVHRAGGGGRHQGAAGPRGAGRAAVRQPRPAAAGVHGVRRRGGRGQARPDDGLPGGGHRLRVRGLRHAERWAGAGEQLAAAAAQQAEREDGEGRR